MSLYAESSAVLAWLLQESAAAEVSTLLAGADLIMGSDLVLVECDRALHRLTHQQELSEATAADLRARLARASTRWFLVPVSEDVVARARESFPMEPVRSMDALHLASALVGRRAVPGISILSLDRRVRDNGQALGFDVLPE